MQLPLSLLLSVSLSHSLSLSRPPQPLTAAAGLYFSLILQPHYVPNKQTGSFLKLVISTIWHIQLTLSAFV